MIRREDSLAGGVSSLEPAAAETDKPKTAGHTEEDRPGLKQLVEDSQSLVKWFSADDDDGSRAGDDISMAEFKGAMKSLGIKEKPELIALCENGDLATSVRALSLLNSKCSNFIKGLDAAKKAEREARAAERAAKKNKEAAIKKAKKDKEEQDRLDKEKILQMEASIILNLDKGTLPTELGDQKCKEETQFYRYSDYGLSFKFGSADFTGLKLFKDGTFEFKNGYKMEFSSARQFVEQSEGLFDDLKGTYDIVWGEMREENGKKIRSIPRSSGVKDDGPSGLRIPKRPTVSGKDNPVREIQRRPSRALVHQLSSKIGMGIARMASSRTSFRGTKENAGGEDGGAKDGGGMGGEEQDQVVYVPLEIVLHPEDMEARRLGLDLTQRWGCYEPGADGAVKKIQRKLSPTVDGEEFVFPEKPAGAAATDAKKGGKK
jgi:hypothetical protein